jgi:hypothetical protein
MGKAVVSRETEKSVSTREDVDAFLAKVKGPRVASGNGD